jgi:drug/metabolite transporter (DMT)-like permease
MMNPTFLAAGWMLGALISFSLLAIGAKEVAANLSVFQTLFFRNLVSLLLLAMILRRNGWKQLSTQHLSQHWLRNLTHFCGISAWFYGLAYLPLAEVFALEFTTPIWTTLVAIWLLGEKLTPQRIAALALGIIGVLVILQPGIAPISGTALVVLAGAACYGVTHSLTKKLSTHSTALCILWYMVIMQLPLSFVLSLPNWQTPQGSQWGWIILMGISGLSAHYCMTRAFQLADAMVVVPMDFLRLPLIMLIGILFYQEPLSLSLLVGAALMLAGNLLNLHRNR